jgi:hypothetical protein
MSGDENNQINAILTLIESRLLSFEKKFDHFDQILTTHVNNSVEAIGDIKLLKNNQSIITSDLQKNFDQHKEFYGLFKVIDKQPNCEDLVKNLREDIEKDIYLINASIEKNEKAIKVNDDKTSDNSKAIFKAKIVIGTINGLFGLAVILLKLFKVI